MTRRTVMTGLGLALAMLAVAQPTVDAVSSKTVVALFAKIDPVFAMTGDLKPFGAVKVPGTTAQRKDVVATLYQVFEHYKPSFRTTPRPFRIIQPYLDLNTDKDTKDKLRELIRWGMVAPASPMVTNGATLSPEEFGDSLAYFYLSLRQVTYQPDPRWTGSLSGLGE